MAFRVNACRFKTDSYSFSTIGIGIAITLVIIFKEFCMNEPLEQLRLLTLSEAADLLQVSTRTLQRMIRTGELPAFKVGGQWRVRGTLLQRWVEQRENPAVESKNDRPSTDETS